MSETDYSRPVRTPLQYVEEWGFDRPAGDHQEIAQMISAYSPGGKILDLGCGPMLPAWALFHPAVEKLAGLDRYEANVDFLKEAQTNRSRYSTFVEAERMAKALRQDAPSLDTVYEKTSEVCEGDVMELQQDWIGAFDVVTQIGCFACLPTNGDVHIAIKHVADYLRPGGVFLSVMWHAKPDFVEDAVWGGNERTDRKRPIDAEYVRNVAAGYGLDSLFEACLPSDETEFYRAFTLQAFQFTPSRLRHVQRAGLSKN